MGEVVYLDPEDNVDEPSLNDGYCKVVNALAEGLASHPLTSIQQRVVWAVIRMTYGWGKPKDVIAAIQLSEVSGLTRQQCSSTLTQLIEYGVITREGGSRSPIKINTKISQWELPKKATKGRISERVNTNNKFCSVNSNSVHSTNSNSTHTKYKRKKDKNTACSTSKKPPAQTSSGKRRPDAAIQNPSGTKYGYQVDLQLSELIARAVDAKLQQDAPANRNLADWANTVRLMRECDNRDPAAIQALFAWAHNDSFWWQNILSPQSLRAKWSQLAAKRNSQRNGEGHEAGRTNNQRGGDLDRQFTDLQYARDTFED
ncbi:replication protein [Marinobacter salarius]|uniref:replication protein n=1 Tax=Marinobacter salarius TaxID=1420917 RepID=UPI003D0BDFD4